MLQRTRPDLIMLDALINEIIPQVSRMPEVALDCWWKSSVDPAHVDYLCFDVYDARRDCMTFRCLLGWAVQHSAFGPYINFAPHASNRFALAEENLKTELGYTAYFRLFGPNGHGDLAERAEFARQLYAERLEE